MDMILQFLIIYLVLDLNKDWLESLGEFTFIHGDTRNKNDVENIIKEGKFDAVFHLAGQVTMTYKRDIWVVELSLFQNVVLMFMIYNLYMYISKRE